MNTERVRSILIGMILFVTTILPASAAINELWIKTYDGGSQDDFANGVATDAFSNVIVTGKSYVGGNWDYHTIKYDKDGNILWNKTFDRGYDDVALDVATDKSGNVIVTGYSDEGGATIPRTKDDYYTIKYDRDGNILWNRTFDGGTWATAAGVATDEFGNVIVTGSFTDNKTFNIQTIKYDENGIVHSRPVDRTAVRDDDPEF